MKLNKIFKWGMVVLILISVALLVWGFAADWLSNDAQPVNVMLNWAYIMIGLALAAWIIVGLIISVKNDPKSIVKMLIVIVGIAALCAVAFLLAKGEVYPGSMAMEAAEASDLKLTDTILNLTYIVGVAAIVAIIVGEIRLAIANKK